VVSSSHSFDRMHHSFETDIVPYVLNNFQYSLYNIKVDACYLLNLPISVTSAELNNSNAFSTTFLYDKHLQFYRLLVE
jgi:hypothetical protein